MIQYHLSQSDKSCQYEHVCVVCANDAYMYAAVQDCACVNGVCGE